MRTKDSLASRESFFYAEIKRLKLLLDRLNQQEKIFVVLDEILKGTNSADQHAGAKALLTQLAHKKAVGLIATHDLRLGEWAKNYPQHFKNQCFEIHIQNNHLHFTYQLKEGINQNLNATFLLKKMGIVEVEM
jgi:DNA mismatch repair ATPase MutS